jgi:hypothetical protein
VKIATTPNGRYQIDLTRPDREAIARTIDLVRDLVKEWPKLPFLVDAPTLRAFLADPNAMAAKWAAEANTDTG